MRPPEFLSFLIPELKQHPEVIEAGYVESRRSRYMLGIYANDQDQRWQVMGQLAAGSSHATLTPPVEGELAAYTGFPATGPPDAWLGGIIGALRSRRIARISVWSQKYLDPDRSGVTLFFHNDERIFIRNVT